MHVEGVERFEAGANRRRSGSTAAIIPDNPLKKE
jgi:hypothetical protein